MSLNTNLCYVGFITMLFMTITTAANQTVCKTNEIFSECGECEATCDNQTPICNRMCGPAGCYCPIGFVRDANKDCVSVRTCLNATKTIVESCATKTCPQGQTCVTTQVQCFVAPCSPLIECVNSTLLTPSDPTTTTCNVNEFYTTCGDCEATCENQTPFCTRICRPPGCYCSKGFVRNTNGTCVSNSTCSTTVFTSVSIPSPVPSTECKTNEKYQTCGTCEVTCDTLNRPCFAICLQPGCYCPHGYVRDTFNNCVSASTCTKVNTTSITSVDPIVPPTCKPNEQYTTCGGCETQCGQPLLFCTYQCRPAGCYCLGGFSRTANGDCVPESSCPATNTPTTPTEAVLNDPCMTVKCTATTKCVAFEVNCIQKPCLKRAQCVPLNANDATGSRVARNIESQNMTACGTNEVYETCGYCEGTCADRHPECASTDCEKPGCYCPRGFIRDSAGRCAHEVVCDPTW